MRLFDRFTGTCLMVLCLGLLGCATQMEPQLTNHATIKERVDARLRWAKELIQEQRYEEAKRPLKQALDIDPESRDANNVLAFVFQRQGELDLAEKHYQKALKADPDYSAVLNNYAIFLIENGRYEEACTYFRRASNDSLYERRPQTLENLGVCLTFIDKKDEAEKVFKQALRLNDQLSNTYLGLADLAFDRGAEGQAREYFDQFLSLVQLRRAEHTAKSLWLGLRLARLNNDPSRAASFALLLKNLYPESAEYQLYKESR